MKVYFALEIKLQLNKAIIHFKTVKHLKGREYIKFQNLEEENLI